MKYLGDDTRKINELYQDDENKDTHLDGGEKDVELGGGETPSQRPKMSGGEDKRIRTRGEKTFADLNEATASTISRGEKVEVTVAGTDMVRMLARIKVQGWRL